MQIQSQNIMTVHYDKKPIYDIVFQNSFDKLAEHMKKLDIENRKLLIVSDSNVAPHYLNAVKDILEPLSAQVDTYVFPAGEESKNLNVVRELYEYLILSHFERNDMLIALGGGVVGDLTGYTAATYLRGIEFVQIPTSLLAQVDSSIGGKTGVDFDNYKNMVGAFHQPKLVYINTSTLSTLNQKQFLSGMGEVIKYGLITDSEFYKWITQHKHDIKELNPEVIRYMIYRSCDNKRQVVEEDPTEKGRRALLNYGHTLGHAIEKLSNFRYLHGDCVAVGCILASELSCRRGYISENDVQAITELFSFFDCPEIRNYNTSEVLQAVKSDKKMNAGQIKFILLHAIGNAYISNDVSDQEMRKVLEDYHG